MINTKYQINGTEYELYEAVQLIKSGKWDSAMNNIKSTCGINDSLSREIGIKIKESIAAFNSSINENLTETKSKFKVTTGFDFDGYRISEYLGIVGGQSAVGTGANALIGVNYNYFSPKNSIMCVSIEGTAVIIESN